MGLTYLALGDSTTVNMTPGKCYPHLIASYIKSNYKPVKLIHKGSGGLKGVELLTNPWYHTNFDADIVTIGVGFNDVSNGEAGIPAFKNALKSTIDKLRLRNANVEIILCTSNNGSGAVLYLLREAMVDVAVKKGVRYCRFETAWSNPEATTYTIDGVHPTENGQILLSNLLKPIIDEILE